MRVTYMTSVNHTLAPNATVLLHAYNFAPNPRKPAQTLAYGTAGGESRFGMRVTYMTSVNHTLARNATVILHAYNFAPNPRKPAQTLAFAHKTSRKFGLDRGAPSARFEFCVGSES